MSFTILKKDKKSGARLGVLKTPHGSIQTPAYVVVATHAEIRALKKSDIKLTGTQVVIANTYHLWDKAKNGFRVQQTLGSRLPTMTDSGGFQVFSLGAAKDHGVGKVLRQPSRRNILQKSKVKFTEKGATFTIDGKKKFLSPEISMDIQHRLGADMIFAFDECTSPLHPLTYQKKSMARTHRWLLRCIKANSDQTVPTAKRSRILDRVGTGNRQLLYGIIQGGRFPALRRQSARFVASQPVGGIAIGGSFGKEEMSQSLRNIAPLLPEQKPRHLLGIGRVEDVFTAVENGMDTFDCVIPTREARHGRIYTKAGPYDVRKFIYAKSKVPLERGCHCPTCSQEVTRAKLHKLFKDEAHLRKLGGLARRSSLRRAKAGRLATLHNVWFFNNLLEKIRKSIVQDKFTELKKSWLPSTTGRV